MHSRAVPAILTVLAGSLGAWQDAGAQTIRGNVTDPVSARPVADALVVVVNEAGERVASAFTDPGGRFAIDTPGSGAYMVGVAQIGYQQAISPRLDIGADDVTLDILLPPTPITLDSLTVRSTRNTPDAGRLRGLLSDERARGTLVGRLTRAEIESRGPRSDLVSLLTTMNIPGLRARRMALSTGAPETGLCVELGRNRAVLQKTRSRLAGARDQLGMADEDDIEARAGACAMVAVHVNDMPVRDPSEVLASITPAELEGLEVVSPLEALARYGARAANGALLLWTR